MRVLQFLQKYRVILIAGAIIVLAVFYLWRDIRSVSVDFLQGRKSQVRKLLECTPKHLDASVLNARKDATENIMLLIHFTERPSADVKEFLETAGVSIDPDSWVYDYVVAEAGIGSLCFLDSLPGITTISLGE